MADEELNEPIPLSDVLTTLQRELSRVQSDSMIAAEGESRALIREDVSFKISFKFTPVAETGTGDDATIDAILVDDAGKHEMTLEGKISPNVEIQEADHGESSR